MNVFIVCKFCTWRGLRRRILESAMESAINSIETLLNEGSELVKLAQNRCNESIFDSKGKRANYTSLVERVNGLGASLAQIKNEIEEFGKDKRELMEMVEKLENADVKEIQKLAAILNKS